MGPGRDHPVAAVLALAAAAVVAGMKGYAAITDWIADVPPAILTDVYLRSGAAPAPPPSKTVREQWPIESLHWIRDTLYQEDKSTVRTRSGPRIMAALRNLAIGALHLAGRHDTTEATRWASRYIDRPFTILGLTS